MFEVDGENGKGASSLDIHLGTQVLGINNNNKQYS